MKLSIIIVNYNVRYFLEQALGSVQKAIQGLEAEVFVVDNNSVDESVQMVREKFPEVQVIANDHNPGFSIANNQAIRVSKGEFVLLLNPDTVVEEDTFHKVVDFMDAHPDAGGLGVRMIDGSGKFLPESKRGFPSPWVAFAKTFGLSSLFPASPLFNHYHLGYLAEDEVHEVEVLAGAFMMLRKSVLDEIGLLDEAFFMYGEDIDLSYRIVKAGYKNYYFPETTILHYKGESTKKGSLNYVRTFYQAMIIFAKKHFKGQQAWLFVGMLQLAIYFRAGLTLFSNGLQKLALPLLDAALVLLGLYVIKDIWATYYFKDPDWYDWWVVTSNFLLYVTVWLPAVYLSGGYDRPFRLRKLVRGLALGTVVLAAVYGFLEPEYRPSRALILFGAMWAMVSMIVIRLVIHALQFGNLNIGVQRPQNLVVVGSLAESKRVMQLLNQAEVQMNFIGTVSAEEDIDRGLFLSSIAQLDEVVQIYKIEEIIFCSKDVSSQEIMAWMSKLGPQISYKIVPKESLSIIGSSSKNTPGELYTIDIRFNIAQAEQRRNKRLLDILISLTLLILAPIFFWFVRSKSAYFSRIFAALFNQKSWVGYAETSDLNQNLPKLKTGIFSPVDGVLVKNLNQPTIKRLNFIYAKDYEVERDVEIVWKGLFSRP